MKLFKENHLNNYLSQKLDGAKSSIQYMADYEIVKTSKEDLLAKLTKDATVPLLSVNLNDRSVNVKMIDVPAEHFPIKYHVHSGEKYPLCKNYLYLYLSK